jgi:glycosyltransferase involved in cell wall biosynthesis
VRLSVLIPAFRPTYLGQAIASVLTQGCGDFEIIVSDDSGGADVKPIVERFGDSRLRYVATSGRTGSIANACALWAEARHDLRMLLLDDDLLLPEAFAEFEDSLAARPEASFHFGHRQIIDQRGKVTAEPQFLRAAAVLDARTISGAIVGSVHNRIGEFSNVLINRAAGLSTDDFCRYAGFDLHVMSDVAFFLNASRKAPARGTPRRVAAFRRHGAQNSSAAFNPKLPFGFVEWELFVRGEFDAGRLEPAEALNAVSRLDAAYAQWTAALRNLEPLRAGLRTLRERIAAGDRGLVDRAFAETWSEIVAEVFAETPRRRVGVA